LLYSAVDYPVEEDHAMDMPQSKAHLLRLIDEEKAGWDALLAEIGEDRMETPGATGPWSFKDVVSHLSGWRKRTLARLTAAATDTPLAAPAWAADLPDTAYDDTINDWIYQQSRDRPLGEVLDEASRQFVEMRELVAALPEDALLTPGRYEWMGGAPLAATVLASFGHLHEEHDPVLRAWLQAQSR
jgi:hypothetical protein